MLTELPADTFLSQFFDALPDAAIYLKAVRAEGQVIDLMITHGNERGELLIAKGVFQVGVGDRILGDNPERRALLQPIFLQYTTLLLTGDTQVFNFLNPVIHQIVRVTRSRIGDGVLVVAREPQSQDVLNNDAVQNKQNVSTEDQLSGILEASLNGIITYEADRDQTGTIQDFRFVRLNNAARHMLALTTNVIGKPMLDLLPGTKERGIYDKFVWVAETGNSLRFETSFPTGDRLFWYDMSVVKLGDGLVVTFNDVTQTKQATLALEQQKNLLKNVIDNVQIGLLLLEPIRNEAGEIVDLLYTLANQKAAHLLGRTVEDMTGQTLLAIYPGSGEDVLPEAATTETILDRYIRQIREGGTSEYEFLCHRDGLTIWFQTAANALPDQKGLVISFADISPIKQAQQAVEDQNRQIKKQANFLASVIDATSNGIVVEKAVRDAEGTIIDFIIISANKQAAAIVQSTVDVLVGQSDLMLHPNLRESGLFDAYVKTIETGEPQVVETYYQDNRLEHWLNVNTRKLDSDELVITFTSTTDIKRSQIALEAAAVQLQTVIDTSQTGIFLFSPVRNDTGEVVDFRFRIANRQLASYVGQEPDVIIGALGSTWFPGYKTNGLFDTYYRTYATGEQMRFDFHYRDDGINVWLDIMSTKMGDEVLVTFGDYTPLKQLQQKLEASVSDLRRSNQNLEQFAYVASHDLQEPLRKIQSFGDILQTQYTSQLGETGADMIRRMQSATSRMQILIRDVLAYSRLTTRRDENRAIQLNKVVQDVLDDLDNVIVQKGAIVNVAALPTIQGDEPQLRQLFQNLIANALKFNKPAQGPVLTITTRPALGRDSGVPVATADADRLFQVIELTDNGIGFDPKQADRIFQIFQRLHGRSSYEGTGIGLAIVQKVVDNHHGYIRATSQAGEGAMFTVLLPV